MKDTVQQKKRSVQCGQIPAIREDITNNRKLDTTVKENKDTLNTEKNGSDKIEQTKKLSTKK